MRHAGTSFRSLDNDAFTHSDDQYTHGLTFSYLSPYLESFEDGLLPTSELHVATTGNGGNDTTGDGSSGSPFATIGHAASQAIPGTAIRVHAGTYPGGEYVSDLAGNATAPIWIGPSKASATFGLAIPLLNKTKFGSSFK